MSECDFVRWSILITKQLLFFRFYENVVVYVTLILNSFTHAFVGAYLRRICFKHPTLRLCHL